MNITKPILALIIVISLLVGGIIGVSTPIKSVEKPVERVVEVEKPVQPEWNQLKVLDEQMFSIMGEGFTVAAEGMEASTRLDVDGITASTAKLKALTEQLKAKGVERQQLLSKLGY